MSFVGWIWHMTKTMKEVNWRKPLLQDHLLLLWRVFKKCFCFCCWFWWSRCCSCKAPGILQTSYYLYQPLLVSVRKCWIFPGCCTDCGGLKLWFWPIMYYPGNWPDYIEFILIYLHNNDFSRVLHTLVLIQSPSSS